MPKSMVVIQEALNDACLEVEGLEQHIETAMNTYVKENGIASEQVSLALTNVQARHLRSVLHVGVLRSLRD